MPSFNGLPRELADSVLKLVPPCSLPSLSLVCRTWHRICFPLLYHTVGLINEEHAETFIQRVLDESRDDEDEQAKDGRDEQNKKEAKDRLRVTGFVRRLYVELSLEGDPERLANLGEAVSRMKQLEHLHWNTMFLDRLDWHSILVLLNKNLPELRSLSLVLPGVEFSLGHSEEVVALTNLQELSINFDRSECDESDETRVPTEIVDLIRGASNLESLSLRFQYDDDFPRNGWAVELFLALAGARFPNLRSFRSRCVDFAPIDFYDRSGLRRFIQNHPQLHTVVLYTNGSRDEDPFDPDLITITPEEMVKLFPSVRHFEGPCLMVEALLRSKLAEPIETLGIIESSSTRMGYLYEILPMLDGLNTFLPRLKVLRIDSNTVTWDNTLAGLVQLVSRMPVLEELLMGEAMIRECTASALDKCLETLKFLPHLHTLGIPQSVFPVSKDNKSKNDKSFFLDAAAICPWLGTVKYVRIEDLYGQWHIVRREGKPVDVVYMRRRGHSMPAGWSDGVDCADLFPPRWHC